MPYLDFAEAWPSFIHTLALQLTTVNTALNANRCQCWKASVQLPEWKTPPNGASDEIAQLANTSFAICTDHFRIHQSFQRVCKKPRQSNSLLPPRGGLSLPPSSSSWTRRLCAGQQQSGCCWSLQDVSAISSDHQHKKNVFTFFFCSVISNMQPSSHEAGGWGVHPREEGRGGEGNWTSFIWWWGAVGSAPIQCTLLVRASRRASKAPYCATRHSLLTETVYSNGD